MRSSWLGQEDYLSRIVSLVRSQSLRLTKKSMRKLMKGESSLKISDLNELVHTKLILSIDVRTNSANVAFNLVKGCKNKDYTRVMQQCLGEG
jgi:hypothetical protein